MNKRRIEKMIIHAMEILNQEENQIVKSGKILSKYIPSEYNGYIASFGPTVIQSGMVQTLAFYNRSDGDAQDRKKILALMYDTLKNAGYLENAPVADNLLDYVRDKDETERMRLKGLILECAVACKLSMRTFPKDESKRN